MSVNLKDCFQTIFEERLSVKLPAITKDVRTEATRLLKKREETVEVDRALSAQKKELEMKLESFRQRKEHLTKKEDKLKESLLKYDKFVKENDARRSRGLRNAEMERAHVRQKELEIQRLQMECDALLARKELLKARVNKQSVYKHFLHSAAKLSGKFEETDRFIARFDTLLSMREQLMKRQSAAEKERERRMMEHRQFINDQNSVLVHYSNTLSQLQSELDSIRSQAYKWESTLKHIQATAAKELLLLGQIKITTLNLYHMTGKVTVNIEDTLEQLDKIKNFIEVRVDIDRDLLPEII